MTGSADQSSPPRAPPLGRQRVEPVRQCKWSAALALTAEGAIVFAHACKLGLEGIVSKRAGSLYRSGTSRKLVEGVRTRKCTLCPSRENEWGYRELRFCAYP